MAGIRGKKDLGNRRNITNSRKKSIKKRKKGGRTLFLFFLFLMFIGIIATLSMTVFFGIKNITVKGNEKYTQDEIIQATGIKTGDNLFRINAKAAQDNVLAKFTYIGSMKISKKLPDTLLLEVQEVKPSYKVDAVGSCLLLDSSSKVLETVTDSQNYNIPEVVGYDISGYSVGQTLLLKNGNKPQIVFDILNSLLDNKIDKIKFVDIKDEYDIKLNYDRKIKIYLGNSQKMQQKIEFLKSILEKIHESETGTIDLRDTSKAFFKPE